MAPADVGCGGVFYAARDGQRDPFPPPARRVYAPLGAQQQKVKSSRRALTKRFLS